MPQIFHALTLHLHQPPDNLQLLIDTNPKEAEQILHCYDRITRFAHRYANIAHLHVAFSGLLLQQLQQPTIIDQYRQFIDIPAMLESYRLAKNIELLGVGMYHPIFPLISPTDWDTQLQLERDLMQKVFGRAPRGFLPPEMAFSMQMIPSLVKVGYEYVLIDASNIHPEHEQVDVFQPYVAHYDDVSITVIPINRDISYAQKTGLDPVWFAHEVQHQVWHSARPDAPRLLSTWSNGENKRWFRSEEDGFFGHFFAPYVEHAENGEYPVLPISISEYLRQHPANMHASIEVGTIASGYGLANWGGSDAQRHAIAKMRDIRQRYEKLMQVDLSKTDKTKLEIIKQQILMSQSSCFLFWGDEWIQKLFEFLQPTEQQLSELEVIYFDPPPPAPKQPIATPQPLVLSKKPHKKAVLPDQPLRPSNEEVVESAKSAYRPIRPSLPPIAKPEVKAESKPIAKPEVKAESKPIAKPEIKAESESVAKPEVKAESKPIAKPEIKAESESVAKPEIKAESKPVAKPEIKAESKPVAKPEIKAESESVAKPEIKAESESIAKPEIKAESESIAKPEIKAESKPVAKPEIKAESESVATTSSQATTQKKTTRRKTTTRKTTKK